MAVVIVQTASRMKHLQYQNIQSKSITDMEKGKILVSDEITEKTIHTDDIRDDELCAYPYAILQDGSRFYFNRFLYL